MFKLLLLIACTAVITTCAYFAVSGFASPSFSQGAMTSFPISIKRPSLVAREQALPPLGSATKQDYPAKSAVVFVELENLQQTDVQVVVQKIEIRNQLSNQLELIDQISKAITLKPLQSSVQDFHLAQAGTFERQGQVKAIVTLKINGQTQMVESDAIKVQPY